MKKLTIIIVLFLSAITNSYAQSAITNSYAQIDWGIKGGLNFNSNGDIIREIDGIIEDGSKSDSKIGYHLGVFLTTKGSSSYYLRPELIYTKTKSEYEEGNFDMSKIDLPILLGFKIIGPISIFAGPSLQYILDTDLEGFSLSDVEKNFTIGLNIGTAVQLGNLGLDLRYERGFTSNEADFLNIDRIDTRPEQIIISLSFKI